MDITCTTSPAGSYFRRSRRTVCMVFKAGKTLFVRLNKESYYPYRSGGCRIKRFISLVISRPLLRSRHQFDSGIFSQRNHIWLGLDFKIYINHCDSFSRISRRRSNAFVFNWSQPWSSHGRFVWSSCTICGGIGLRSCIRRRYKYLFGSNYHWRRNFRI